MRTDLAPRILSADRISGGVIITFSDGKCAIYSASLLHATLAQAKEFLEPVKTPSKA